MKLYEITEAIARLDYDIEVALETDGELPGDISDRFGALEVERERKISDLACLIKHKEAFSNALKAEADKLYERAGKVQRSIDWLENYLASNMQPGERFEDARCRISWRQSKAIEITDESLVPPEFWRTREVRSVDKVSIAQRMAAGEQILGATVVTRNNLQIK